MRMVTKILELSKSRNRIYIDQQFAFVLYKGELRMYHIKENQEIPEEVYQTILTELLPKRAKLRAMNLLKDRSYTEKQLRDKLMQGYYGEELIDEAVAYVKSYGYIDDRKYTEDFIHYHLGTKSIQRVKMDLCRKGVSKDLIEEQLNKLEEVEKPDERVMIRTLLEKRHFDPDQATIKEKQKMYAYLFRRGYQSDDIKEVINTSFYLT